MAVGKEDGEYFYEIYKPVCSALGPMVLDSQEIAQKRKVCDAMPKEYELLAAFDEPPNCTTRIDRWANLLTQLTLNLKDGFKVSRGDLSDLMFGGECVTFWGECIMVSKIWDRHAVGDPKPGIMFNAYLVDRIEHLTKLAKDYLAQHIRDLDVFADIDKHAAEIANIDIPFENYEKVNIELIINKAALQKVKSLKA